MTRRSYRSSYGILKFPLPEEKEEFLLAINAGNMSSCISEIQEYLRKINKYEFDSWLEMDKEKILKTITEDIREIIQAHNVDLN